MVIKCAIPNRVAKECALLDAIGVLLSIRNARDDKRTAECEDLVNRYERLEQEAQELRTKEEEIRRRMDEDDHAIELLRELRRDIAAPYEPEDVK